MNPLVPMMVASNEHLADKLLTAAGYVAGLGQMDVRELSQTRIPVWGVAAVSAIAGVAAGLWLARRLPSEWVLGKRDRDR